jgi:hypothetical protein
MQRPQSMYMHIFPNMAMHTDFEDRNGAFNSARGASQLLETLYSPASLRVMLPGPGDTGNQGAVNMLSARPTAVSGRRLEALPPRHHRAARPSLRSRLAVFSTAALAALAMASRMASAGPIEAAFHKSAAGSTVTVDHAPWTRLLATYVRPQADGLNRVDYARFKAEARPQLKAYLSSLEAADPTKLDRAEQFAYWANLYNAKTIDVVLEAYPVASIKDIKLGGILSSGPWSKKNMKVAGIELSLDDIEHTILRPSMKDPRVHYSVNCASVGCPNLGVEAFTGARLEEQLNAAARAFVNHPRGFKAAGGKIEASKIYSWFKADFGNSDAGVLAHARTYADGSLKAALTSASNIGGHDYDWGLNDVSR